MEKEAPRRTTLLLLVALALAGICGFARDALRGAEDGRVVAQGSFWLASDASGELLTQGAVEGLLLPVEATLQVVPREEGGRSFERVRLDFKRLEEAAWLDLHLRDGDGRRVTIKVGTKNTFGVTVLLEEDGKPPRLLARNVERDFLPGLFQTARVEARFDGKKLDVEVQGELAASVPDVVAERGGVRARARGAALRVGALSIVGREGDRALAWAEYFSALEPQSRGSIAASAVATALALLALAAGWLGLLTGARVHPALLARAALVLLAPLALYAASGLVRPLAHLPLAAALAPLLGLLPALFVLRGSQDGVPTRAGTALAAAAGLAAAALAAHAFASRESVRLAVWHQEARAALARPQPSPFGRREALELDAASALVVPGAWRDFDLEAKVHALSHDALLEVRLRVNREEAVALFVAAEATDADAAATRFVREEQDAFAQIATGATGAGRLPVGAAATLVVRARGSRYSAELDGRPLLDVEEDLYSSGAITLLAAAGAIRLEGVAVSPVVSTGETGAAPPLAGKQAVAAGRALLAALLCGVAGAWLLRRRIVPSLAGAACGLLPVAWLLIEHGGERGPPGDEPRLAAAVAAGVLLAAPALAHARRAGALRAQAALLVAAAAAAFLWRETGRRPWPPTEARMNSIALHEWEGERIPRARLHLEHPLARRWNAWLVDHTLRGRRYALAKPAGTKRVVALGTSSTYGYGVGEHYPVVAEGILRSEGVPVEVLNAAWSGATGNRLLIFLENVLLRFDPDVVTLSLYYNDSVALTQGDEGAYFERIAAPGFSRGVLEALRGQVLLGLAPDFNALDAALGRGALTADAALARFGSPSATPPARFEALLERFAVLARERGFQLVLMEEPVAGDKPRLWKDEFRAAMRAVSARHGLVLIDPTPALLAAGGATLFMDPVHPYVEGHRVVAGVVAPALREALAR